MYPVETHISPNKWVGRTAPISEVVIHSTRSGNPLADDYACSINWFLMPESEVSAHIVVARDGRRCRCVEDRDTAWHAGSENPRSLGIELEQQTPETPFTDDCLKSAAEQVAEWCVLHCIPPQRGPILGHEHTLQGQRAGKSDPGVLFPWNSFIDMVEANVTADVEARQQISVQRMLMNLASLAMQGKLQELANALKYLGITPAA